ncbi:MAG: hypothetical protein ACRELZ_19150 [Candidatus Rokuibacteriota bacterium]
MRIGLVIALIGLALLPAAMADEALDDLLSALQIAPLGDQRPAPFALDSLDGRRVALADLRGLAVLLYFWEST